jgi:hypothetical protein
MGNAERTKERLRELPSVLSSFAEHEKNSGARKKQ